MHLQKMTTTNKQISEYIIQINECDVHNKSYYINKEWNVRTNSVIQRTGRTSCFITEQTCTRVLKKFCHWVWIILVLCFIKTYFITNQSVSPLLKHIFVIFLPSREKQINSLLLVSVGDTDK